MANARGRKRRSESSTLQTLASLIRETDPALWEILHTPSLQQVTIGDLLQEAKALRVPLAGSSQRGAVTFAFHRHLTEREAQVADLVAQGDSNQEIGERLELSAKTVKNHVSNILHKLSLQRRTQIAILALHERTKADDKAR